MKSIFNLTFIFLFFLNKIYSQEITLLDHSCFCEEVIEFDGKQIQERIDNIQKTYSGFKIDFIFIHDCGMKFYPICQLDNDTLFIHTEPVFSTTLYFENGQTKEIDYMPEECYCAYEMKMELKTDTLNLIKINNRVLPRTKEKYKTYPVKYFTYENDTTGFIDQYGLRQGCLVISGKNSILKTYYKDGRDFKHELFDRNKKLLIESNDIHDIYKYQNKNK